MTQTGTAPIRFAVSSGPSALSGFWRNYNLSSVLAALRDREDGCIKGVLRP